MKTVLTLLLVSILPALAGGATYKWVDEHGKVHYSDQPPPADARKIEKKKVEPNVVDTSEMPYQLRNAVKKHPVTLYTTACGEPCDKARDLLKSRGVPYTERDAQQPAQSEELKKLSGGLEVPVLQVGQSKVVKGFEQAQWHRELDAAGYPKTSVLPKVRAPAPLAPDPGRAPAKINPATDY